MELKGGKVPTAGYDSIECRKTQDFLIQTQKSQFCDTDS